MALFISTSGIKAASIVDAVDLLIEQGYRNLELSGGTDFVPHWHDEIAERKAKFGLHLRVHNYFPPPSKHFVLNVMAPDPSERKRSLEMVGEAVRCARSLGDHTYGLHAGILRTIATENFGQAIPTVQDFDRQQAHLDFTNEMERIAQEYADIQFFVENHCLNRKSSQGTGHTPLLVVTPQECQDFAAHAGKVKFLLDIAHFHVSCHSLGLDFKAVAPTLLAQSRYVHVSDNDGSADQNLGLKFGSPIFDILSQVDLSQKDVTIEVNEGLPFIAQTFETLSGWMNL
jgi:sugar phosphate isomerase/epimerase